MYKYFLSHARVGIYLSILNENFLSTDEILLPDYICESVPNFLIAHGIKVKFYKINLSLKANWTDLKNNLSKNSKMILVVNYFGFPTEIDKFIQFSKKNNLKMIEDSTHGHFGIYQDNLMGTFGDYGVTSPRKHLPLPYGCILYSKTKIFFFNKIKVFYKTSNIRKFNYYFTNNFIDTKLSIKKLFNKEIKNIENFYEPLIKISKLDKFSKTIILNFDWKNLKNIKKNNFYKCISFLEIQKLQPLINDKVSNLNPWACPVMLSSEKEVINWLNWGKNNKKIIYNWPTLHQSIDKNSDAYRLSRMLVCFSTYCSYDF